MNISYNWLKTYLKTELNLTQLTDLLTDIGLEVGGTKQVGKNDWSGVVVGRVLSCTPHPNADKLKLTNIDIGQQENLAIVCGAPNIAVGQNVPLATVGTVLYDDKDAPFKIKKSKIRGEYSYGMVCSEVELSLGQDNSGIMVLDSDLKAGTPINTIYKPKVDYLIEIDLTPNRADAMSHFGVARDLFAACKARKIPVELMPISVEDFQESSEKNPIEIQVGNTNLAPRYLGLSLSNIQVKPSPDWLQSHLKTIGIQPKNIVVDVTNYILHDLGQPLHAFDAEKITGNKIVVKTLPNKTNFVSLEQKTLALHQDDLMICNAKEPMCMAGILGGFESGVTKNTTRVLLESAFFEPVGIRKSAKRHGINTDASFRFERQIDPNLCKIAIKKAALLLIEHAGATIDGEITDIYPNPIQDKIIDFRLHVLDRVAGQKIHREQVKQIFTALEIELISEHNTNLQVKVPAYRADVEREIDLIEEVLRIYGYNNIRLPKKISFQIPQNLNNQSERKLEEVLNLLVNNGFYEAINNSLNKLEYNNILFPESTENVRILNSLSADLLLMRQSLLPRLLENVAYNINRQQNVIRLLEFGKTYSALQEKYQEKEVLALVISGQKQEEFWAWNTVNSNFFQLKSYVNQICEKLGVTIDSEKPLDSNDNIFLDGIQLHSKKNTIAKLGLVGKKIKESTNLKQTVYYAELDWKNMVDLSKQKQIKHQDLPKFPGSRRDLALLLNKDVQYKDLYKTAKSINSKLIKTVNLFDVYEGNKLPNNKKSYALSFYFQNPNKTVTDQEIDKIIGRLVHKYQTEYQAQLRN